MRILDIEADHKLNQVILYLTPREVGEFRDKLDALLKDPQGHSHISSEDFQKEITVCMYDPDSQPDPQVFNKRSIELILYDR